MVADQSPDPRGPLLQTRFEHETTLTVGIEEELLLLDPGSFLPVAAGEDVLARVGPDDRYRPELLRTMVELVTAPAATVAEAARELADARSTLVDLLDGGVRLAALGTHPFATDTSTVTPTARYLEIVDELRGVPTPLRCGLHVHVALADADQAVTVHNAVRSYLPEIAALAANSPFFDGLDTGLSSVRLKLSDRFPRSGIPPAFPTWRAFAEFVAWGARGGVVRDPSYHWWDLRLNALWGTLEFRVADVQPTVGATAAVAAVCQSLVASLVSRLAAGEPLPADDSYRIAENRWRALRDGVDGALVDLRSGFARPTRERLTQLLDELECTAASLGCAAELDAARRLIAANGATHQRAVARARGIAHIAEWAAGVTEASEEAARESLALR
jgi:carboxylate-amine ligase